MAPALNFSQIWLPPVQNHQLASISLRKKPNFSDPSRLQCRGRGVLWHLLLLSYRSLPVSQLGSRLPQTQEFLSILDVGPWINMCSANIDPQLGVSFPTLKDVPNIFNDELGSQRRRQQNPLFPVREQLKARERGCRHGRPGRFAGLCWCWSVLEHTHGRQGLKSISVRDSKW